MPFSFLLCQPPPSGLDHEVGIVHGIAVFGLLVVVVLSGGDQFDKAFCPGRLQVEKPGEYGLDALKYAPLSRIGALPPGI